MAALLAVAARGAGAQAPDGKWAVVDTAAGTLTVFSADGRRLAEYRNIAIGQGGVSAVHYKGDRTTPRGSYRILLVRASAHFGTFYLLDYPTPEQAEQAYRSGRLKAAGLAAVLAAQERGLPPPQSTALGGAIGIHGLGDGSLRIHRAFNWTSGCVALDNAQLRDFSRFASVGMGVVIR